MIEDPALFDAPFFSVTKSEALTLDPQQRLLMENVYQALENGRLSYLYKLSSQSNMPI
jgi:acyl transferase domain-containing protein